MKSVNRSQYAIAALALLVMAGCATSPPDDVDNVCDIFRENARW